MQHPRADVIRMEAEAFAVFDLWCRDYNADGEMDMLEAALAYSQWAAGNSIEPYLAKVRETTLES